MGEMRQIVVEFQGRIYKGYAYWSDRTVPGKWIYPLWLQELRSTAR